MRLSIVIPTYNGARHLKVALDAIVPQLEEGVELVVCDDHSSDGTAELVRAAQKQSPRVRLFVNERNLGMDRNFEAAVEHATGEFFWFCGQDDVLVPGAVRKVLDVLSDGEIDFVYVNFGQYRDDLTTALKERMLPLREDVRCRDFRQFLELTDQRLPTFLPAFVLRRSVWKDAGSKKDYYGTQYIQLGVLLGELPRIKTYLIADPLVKGRIPEGGWHEDDLKALDCVTGYFEVVTIHHRKHPEVIDDALFARTRAVVWTHVFGNLTSLRFNGRSLNDKVNARIARLFDRPHRLIIRAIAATPTFLFRWQRRVRGIG